MPYSNDTAALAVRVPSHADIAEQRRRRPGWTPDGTAVDAAGVPLLTVDEIADRFQVPRADVAYWVASGRLSSAVYLPHSLPRYRKVRVVALLEKLAAERDQAARRLPTLDQQQERLLRQIASGQVARRQLGDVLLDRNGRVRAYLGDQVRQLPPGLAEVVPSGAYRLTLRGEACLTAAVAP